MLKSNMFLSQSFENHLNLYKITKKSCKKRWKFFSKSWRNQLNSWPDPLEIIYSLARYFKIPLGINSIPPKFLGNVSKIIKFLTKAFPNPSKTYQQPTKSIGNPLKIDSLAYQILNFLFWESCKFLTKTFELPLGIRKESISFLATSISRQWNSLRNPLKFL